MIDTLLFYGYLPDCVNSGLPESVVEAVQKEPIEADYSGLVSRGLDALEDAIEAELKTVEGDDIHVVPLSSGLDSRAILAELVNHPRVDRDRITTVTFGTPGTWDFDLSKQVATAVDVENITMNLTSADMDWSESSLRNYAKTQNCPTRLIEGYVNHRVASLVDADSVVWSGFMGSESVGSHQPKTPTNSWKQAIIHFVDHNRHTNGLVDSTFDPESSLPSAPYLPRESLTLEEQLDFAHRQQCYIKPLVVSEEDRYLTPFSRPEWLDYSLNLPASNRRNRSLFVDVVIRKHPELFSLPTDMREGLPPTAHSFRYWSRVIRRAATKRTMSLLNLNYQNPGMNYLNFNEAFRREGDLRESAESLISSFGDRTGRPVDQVWEAHQSGQDNANEIRSICSAELYLSESKNIDC